MSISNVILEVVRDIAYAYALTRTATSGFCIYPQDKNRQWYIIKVGVGSMSKRKRNRTLIRKIKIRKGESRHHRLAVSLGGSDDESNISIVNKHHHDCYHTIFSNYTVQTIANILNEKWIDPRYKLIVVER